jgi:hypothetical protein
MGKGMRVGNVGGRGLVRKWLRVGKGARGRGYVGGRGA